MAASSLIGQQIGKGDLKKAKLFYESLQVLSAITLIIASLGIYVYRKPFVSSFTSNDKIVELAYSVTWVVTITVFPDNFKAMQQGVIRAIGIQSYAVYINLVGYWIINLSLWYLLAFKCGLGVLGMWLSEMILQYFLLISQSLLLHHYDWNKSIEKVKLK